MADPNNVSQYKYSAMSNLVLQHDRRFTTRRTDEATGDPESLAGRLNVRDMGLRAARGNLAEAQKKKTGPNVVRGDIQEGAEVLARERKRKREAGPIHTAANMLVEGLRYQPRTPATRDTYSHILSLTASSLGDVSHEVLCSATDAILEYLNDSDLRDFDKKKKIEDLLGESLTSQRYNELVNLSKKLSDYHQTDEMEGQANDQEEELDDRQGVAVVFDDSEGDNDSVVLRHELSDEDQDSDAADSSDEAMLSPIEQAKLDNEVSLPSDRLSRISSVDPEDSLDAKEIDAFWLQRELSSSFSDPHEQQVKAQQAYQILADQETNIRDAENSLMELFDYENHSTVQKLLQNRMKIVYTTQWRRLAENSTEREELEKDMVASGYRAIVDELYGVADSASPAAKRMRLDLGKVNVPAKEEPEAREEIAIEALQPKKLINLDDLAFDQEDHLMTNPSVKLPPGSTKRSFKGYEEIHIPAPKLHNKANERALIPATALPDWARPGFGSAKNLNAIQSKCYDAAFNSDENLLVCAPTGSGKTNVAMLAILREIGKHRNPDTGEIMLDTIKIVFVSPLKALVQEQAGNFGKRLQSYGIKVSELTGDRQLTKQQIAETQVIITTPEKWDVITRKQSDVSYTNLVRLICIDEIHLLHSGRGPVLEAIVSRTIRKIEKSGEPVRLVGLSATLPNYRDVADFLRVDPQKGLFHFDGSYRPCPLYQEFIGVTDRKPIKQLKTMNEICYNKVLEQVGVQRQQVLVFVHSRKEAAKTARYIKDKALELETIGQILRSDAASREILEEESKSAQDRDLKELMPYGFGIHHAGMTRSDRTAVEETFSEGLLQVLVCTATLAWGVNLPAHCVIIRGTSVYEPKKGSWVELSMLDVLQMCGRAGRPGYDTSGHSILLTTSDSLQYYLSLLAEQLPIESQFASKLADNLNAEIVLGTIKNRSEAASWLEYCYYHVRSLKAPGLYSIGLDYEKDYGLEQRRTDLIHSAALLLEKSGLIKYSVKSGSLAPTDLGRIASHYYIAHNSMALYNQNLQPLTSAIELFRIFALSEEFRYIPVRPDEKVELAKILSRVPIPIKEGLDENLAKINALLQSYISRLKLEGLALMADLVYITQSAGRILRAIFEIALKKGYAAVATLALDLCKMAEKRMWPTMTPLRQFPTCDHNVIQKAERIDVPWQHFIELAQDPPRMGELLGMPKSGRAVCNIVQKFPRLDVQAQVQPITRSMLRVELNITPMFTWDEELHGKAENFWILVEDTDGEEILFHDQFTLSSRHANSEMKEHLVEFYVPISVPQPPHYFVSIISDRWLHSETKITLSFKSLILPEKFPPHTQLLDLQPLSLTALKRPDFQALYKHFDSFNKIQTQTFNSLFCTDDSVLIAAPAGSGKTVCAEWTVLRHWASGAEGRAIYIAPFQEQIDQRHSDWVKRMSHLTGGKTFNKLSGELNTDLKLLHSSDVILATPQQWDSISRQWQRRKDIQSVKLFIADDIFMVGGQGGFIYETIVSRMHYISLQTESKSRLIGLSMPLSNARDFGEWIGATKHAIYNFSPHTRSKPLNLQIQSFTIPHFPSLMLAMAKPTYHSIIEMSPDKPAIVFVPTRKQVRSTTADILMACISEDGDEDRFLHANVEDIQPLLNACQELPLAEALAHGVGYYHEALSDGDKKIVSHLFRRGVIQIVVVSKDCCWELEITSYLVVVMGTQFYDGREHRYIDYPLSDILTMLGKANRKEDQSARAVLMVPAVKRSYYKKFLNEALTVELNLNLHDAIIPEISTRAIASTQDAVDWFTYSLCYRRLLSNPSYYGLVDVSHEGLSTFLSELVETTLKELSEAKLIELDEEDDTVTPLNAAMIAAYYNISYITIQTFLLSLTGRTKMKQLLEIVTSATEFESIQIRRHEDVLLKKIYDNVPLKLDQPEFESPHFKAFLLTQAHFSRLDLPADLAKDQEIILSKIITLLNGCVDILSSESHLDSAMRAMEMSQMVVQSMWKDESPLKQIPHFGDQEISAATEAGINDVFDFVDQISSDNSKQLRKALRLNDNKQLTQIAAFTNKYPNVELEYEVLDPEEITTGSPSYLKVKIARDIDEDEDEEPDTTVEAPYFPVKKTENWWLVVGGGSSLLAIKKVSFGKSLEIKLEYVVAEPGKQDLKLYCICDSYVGVDIEETFSVTAAEGMDEDEDEEEDGDDE